MLLSVLTALAMTDCATDCAVESDPSWQLVWQDEFEQPKIDAANWSFEVNAWGGGNNELQYYTDRPKNAYIKNGALVIAALKEKFTGPEGTRQYTSARLRSKNKADFLYGRFEVRAKLPAGQGIWPAAWMLPTDEKYGGWAASGEIDIVEAVNLEGTGDNLIHGTIHYGDKWPKNKYRGKSFMPLKSVVDDYHVYAIEWKEGEIKWFVDDEHYQTLTKWSTPNAEFPAPFDQPFHLLLNLAVGGNWPGAVGENTSFPAEFIIDYVRVYQQVQNNVPSSSDSATTVD